MPLVKIQLAILFKIQSMVIKIKEDLDHLQTQIIMVKVQTPSKINFQAKMEEIIRLESIQLHFQAKIQTIKMEEEVILFQIRTQIPF